MVELAKGDGIPVEETVLTPMDIFSADEAFLTGTAAEVIPMVSLDGRKLGCGNPGEITQKLMALYKTATTHGVAF